jgi:hypothetical protein
MPWLHDDTYGHGGKEVVVAVNRHEHHVLGALAHELMHVLEDLLDPKDMAAVDRARARGPS